MSNGHRVLHSPFEITSSAVEDKSHLTSLSELRTAGHVNIRSDLLALRDLGRIQLAHRFTDHRVPVLRREAHSAQSINAIHVSHTEPSVKQLHSPSVKKRRLDPTSLNHHETGLEDSILDMALELDGRHDLDPMRLPDSMFMINRSTAMEPVLLEQRLEVTQIPPRDEARYSAPSNSDQWRSALTDLDSRGIRLEPLTCLAAVDVMFERILCHGLSKAGIDLVDRVDLEADLVVSPKTAIVFQHVAALASDCDRLAAYLGGLCDRYQRVVIVMILHPRKERSDSIGIFPHPWSTATSGAYQKLQQKVSRRKGSMVSTCETAAAMNTEYEYVISDDAKMSGLIVRVCAERDEKEYTEQSDPEFARAIFCDRDYLRWDNEMASTDKQSSGWLGV